MATPQAQTFLNSWVHCGVLFKGPKRGPEQGFTPFSSTVVIPTMDAQLSSNALYCHGVSTTKLQELRFKRIPLETKVHWNNPKPTNKLKTS